MSSHLVRRGGIWWARLVVPVSLRVAVAADQKLTHWGSVFGRRQHTEAENLFGPQAELHRSSNFSNFSNHFTDG